MDLTAEIIESGTNIAEDILECVQGKLVEVSARLSEKGEDAREWERIKVGLDECRGKLFSVLEDAREYCNLVESFE